MLITLTKSLTTLTQQFLNQALDKEDAIIVSGTAIYLALVACPMNNTAYIRESDANKLGSHVHPSWGVINDVEWATLICEHEKTVTW